MVRRWAPVVIWAAVILLASSDLFSASHSGNWLHWILRSVFRHDLPPPEFSTLHFVIRKLSHLTEYGILGWLAYRANGGHVLGAIAVALAVAITDEVHQSFVPSRTSSPVDVGIDIAGASLATLIARLRRR